MNQSAAIWILGLLAAALAVPLGLFLVLRVPGQRRSDDLPMQWPLTARPVFGGAERRMYRQLVEALPQQVILAKLPLVRLCQPSDPDPAQVRYWFRLLGAIHVSFAVCDAHGRVLAALDLVSARNAPNPRTTRIKTAVLQACQVRYLSCTPDTLPSLATLRTLLPQPIADQSGVGATQTALPMAAAPAPSGADFARSGQFDDSYFAPAGESLLSVLSESPAQASAPQVRL